MPSSPEPVGRPNRALVGVSLLVALAYPAIIAWDGFQRLDQPGVSRTNEAIHLEMTFMAAPARVFEALMDAKQFSAMTGGQAAEIDRAPGGTFSLFGERIKGRNIDIVANTRIVQAWRSEGWKDKGAYSIVRFELSADTVAAKDGSATKLVFDQTGFPAGEGNQLAAGWKTNYWDDLTKYLK